MVVAFQKPDHLEQKADAGFVETNGMRRIAVMKLLYAAAWQ